jgi:ribosomal-protein-alanine N-acetyltransferase
MTPDPVLTPADVAGNPLAVHPLRPDDLPFFRTLAQDARVTRYVGDGAPWADAYVEQRFYDALHRGEPSGRDVRWFIAERADGHPVGLLALTLHPQGTELGYWIAPELWGNGYATQLLQLALPLARDSWPGLPLIATVHRHNAASGRVLQRAGFVEVDAAGSVRADEVAYRLV